MPSRGVLPPSDPTAPKGDGMLHVITCPTGFIGSIRDLKVREERFLADRKLARPGSIVDEFLRLRCLKIGRFLLQLTSPG